MWRYVKIIKLWTDDVDKDKQPKSIQLDNLTLGIGSSAKGKKWTLPKLDISDNVKLEMVSMTRSYLDTLFINTLRLEQSGVYTCGNKQIFLNVQGK